MACRTNIVWIIADDMAYTDMAWMPFLSSIRDQAADFSAAFCPFPLCGPSRASLLTGQMPHNHGCVGNNPPHGGYEAFAAKGNPGKNIGSWMRQAGYRTGMVANKLINGWPGDEMIRGWDDYHVTLTLRQDRYDMTENGIINHYEGPGTWAVDHMRDLAIDFVRTSAGAPFFLYLSPSPPHGDSSGKVADRHAGIHASEPLPQGPNFNEADVSDKPPWIADLPLLTAAQIAEMEVDYRMRLERLLATDELMEALWPHLPPETIVIFTSDNGFALGAHRLSAKEHIYEETARAPLLAWGHGIVPGERNQLASLVDLVATTLDYGGAVATRTQDGRSLRPLLETADHAAIAWRTAIGIDGRNTDAVVEDIALGLTCSARTARYAYMRHVRNDGVVFAEMYDLETDPDQLLNIAKDDSYSEVRERMTGYERQLRACIGDQCWIEDAAAVDESGP